MIGIYNDYITNKECDEFVNFYKSHKENIININDDVYRFDGVSLINNLNDFTFLNRIKIPIDIIDRIRVQRVGPDINTFHSFHRDWLPQTFIIFLNEEFEGGELIYENIIITPKKLQMVTSTGDEWHYVKKVTSGDRFTLVCFLKNIFDFKSKKLL